MFIQPPLIDLVCLPGNAPHNSLTDVDCFFSPIFSYFCLFVAALRPCQGSEPRKKYIKTWPNASKSSRLDCSMYIRRGLEKER